MSRTAPSSVGVGVEEGVRGLLLGPRRRLGRRRRRRRVRGEGHPGLGRGGGGRLPREAARRGLDLARHGEVG